MHPSIRIALSVLLAAVQPVAHADPGVGTKRLGEAFAAAWARLPAAQGLPERERAAAARNAAAAAWTPQPPAVEFGARSDRLNRNQGADEGEAGLAIPLWLPGERGGARAQAAAEADAQAARAALLRLDLAGRLRNAWWDWQLAEAEWQAAEGNVASAGRLRDDVARRVAAGDLARADRHQAEGAWAALREELAMAQQRRDEARFQLRMLTGEAPASLPVAGRLPGDAGADGAAVRGAGAPTAPAGDSAVLAAGTTEAAGEPETPLPADAGWLEAHPQLRELAALGEAARQGETLARVRSRANPEITVGTRRERGARGDAIEQTWALGVRIPLSSSDRHVAAQAEAAAVRMESEALLQRERERLAEAAELARRQRLAAGERLTAAETRARLARETAVFYDKAFRLGEADLPTRLRIAQEAFTAERALIRARIQLAAAVSAQRQALGLLPE
ncbi:TolC family protein [Azonexus sp. R2A61]|uniref:TolC family protein n=1 Tax=Azonexus sp. R2A61 TaxID=2744443 RepID=UPI001F29E19C|nr:TolC family protein [Azonexus sp. R2A61]